MAREFSELCAADSVPEIVGCKALVRKE